MKVPRRVAVLMGGPSREHGISRKSGAAVSQALGTRGLDVLPVTIEQDGRWLLPGGAAPLLTSGEAPETGLRRVAEHGGHVDAVFVALHGPWGEDGTVQGVLETAGIPYTGSGVAASALAMDKERTKEVLCHHGIRTPAWRSVGRGDELTDLTDPGLVEPPGLTELGVTGPWVVKPAQDGSSFGITLVDRAVDLPAAVQIALGDGASRDGFGRALIEQRIVGTEVSCPVLGNSGGTLRALPVVEIVPRGREFFDFEAKYEGASDEICPARIPDDVRERVQAASVTAHRVLRCDGLSRSDFICDDDGVPWFLETNTIPGMTPESLSPKSALNAGMSFAELCEVLVELAIARA